MIHTQGPNEWQQAAGPGSPHGLASQDGDLSPPPSRPRTLKDSSKGTKGQVSPPLCSTGSPPSRTVPQCHLLTGSLSGSIKASPQQLTAFPSYPHMKKRQEAPGVFSDPSSFVTSLLPKSSALQVNSVNQLSQPPSVFHYNLRDFILIVAELALLRSPVNTCSVFVHPRTAI